MRLHPVPDRSGRVRDRTWAGRGWPGAFAAGRPRRGRRADARADAPHGGHPARQPDCDPERLRHPDPRTAGLRPQHPQRPARQHHRAPRRDDGEPGARRPHAEGDGLRAVRRAIQASRACRPSTTSWRSSSSPSTGRRSTSGTPITPTASGWGCRRRSWKRSAPAGLHRRSDEGRRGGLRLCHRVHDHATGQRLPLCRQPRPCWAATAAWWIWSGTMGLLSDLVDDGRARTRLRLGRKPEPSSAHLSDGHRVQVGTDADSRYAVERRRRWCRRSRLARCSAAARAAKRQLRRHCHRQHRQPCCPA